MSKTNTKHIDRRALLKGASIATAAVAIIPAAAVAISNPQRAATALLREFIDSEMLASFPGPALAEAAGADPIFAMVAARDRVRALSDAACKRLEHIRAAWPVAGSRLFLKPEPANRYPDLKGDIGGRLGAEARDGVERLLPRVEAVAVLAGSLAARI
jgi:hypothetical protein